MTKPVNLALARAEATDSNTGLTPRDVLEDALNELDEGADYNGIVVLKINHQDGQFSMGFSAGNISCSQMIAAAEIFKAKQLNHMGWLLAPDDIEYV
ncbi:hypothetical protein [Photobacterium halotolerans]|uniref:hypothetical protein n=1 Tax=Photobacterium halotolerans TaxID=265726 RepID=UPI0004888758|nr:hypothetical protein [Photobacterium halotolerans]